MKKMEMRLHHHRTRPAIIFDKAELVDGSPPMKGNASVPAGGCDDLPEVAHAHTWFAQPHLSNCEIIAGGHEGFTSIQHSFNVNKVSNVQNANRLRHIQNILPFEVYNWSGSGSDMKYPSMLTPSYTALNAGSLVLDSSRGELVTSLKMTSKEILEAKTLAASRSHSEAERRRRERINSHLATLRTIVPNSVKSDKASLLAEVIDQVKKLKRQVSDVYSYGGMPSESDELVVENSIDAEEKGGVAIGVSLCCDDRPDLMTDLKHALVDILKLRIVKVEMSTLGGRMRSEFLVVPKEEEGVEHDVDALKKRMQEALRLVMERPGKGELLQGKQLSKRQRLTTLDGHLAPPPP